MGAGDTLVFENYSVRPMRITFTEQADLRERIRCGLVKQKEAEKAQAPPQQLFAWSDGKLVGTIPPGRFASVCSFREGPYTFVTARLGVEARPAGGGGLPAKGEVIEGRGARAPRTAAARRAASPRAARVRTTRHAAGGARRPGRTRSRVARNPAISGISA